ncbi:hypothetical protein OG474_44960 [Kribbella sp. NBC_01505]|uniref:hypothetical protein n=1 Tax=Kribbella sp. NBC_01505 TaxID=2903580 RepID=UPI003869B125
MLDPDQTVYAAGGRVIVKPVISPRLAARHRVFRLPKDVTRLIVADDVRQAVLAANCAGVNFETVP